MPNDHTATRTIAGVLAALTACVAMAGAQPPLAPVQTLFDGTGLGEAAALAVSPDGEFVYAAGRGDDAIAVFSRQPDGSLDGVQLVRDGSFGVTGLQRVAALAISPDGSSLYAGGAGALVSFARNEVDGLLQFVDSLSQDNVPGLNAVQQVAVSPDGRNVYTTGSFDTLSTFERLPATGRLVFRSSASGADGIAGLQGLHGLAVHPNGELVYVGASQADALSVFTRDPDSGDLSLIGTLVDNRAGIDALNQIRGIAINASGTYLYTAAHDDDGLTVFALDPDTGTPVVSDSVQGEEFGLDGAYAVAVAADESRVFVASLEASTLTVFDQMTDGTLSPVERFDDDLLLVDGLAGAIDVTAAPDGNSIYVAGFFDDAIAVFDTSDPVTAFVEAERNLETAVGGITGARAVVTSDDGANVYIASEDAGAIAVFGREPTSGRLTLVEIETSFDEVPTSEPVALAMSPDDLQLFAVDRGSNALIVFDRTLAADGVLRGIRALTADDAESLRFPTDVAVTPDGSQLFVTSALRNALNVIDRDTNTFLSLRISFANEDGLGGAAAVAVAPDGESIYVAGARDGALRAFARDPQTGEVTLGAVVTDDRGGLDTLRGASDVLVSDDGANVYVGAGGGPLGGEAADAITVFGRNPDTKALTLLESFVDELAGIQGLAGVSSIAITPDGDLLVATAADSDAVAVFSREPAEGRLTFLGAQLDGVGGFDGLEGASGCAVSSDGKHLYATAATDSAVSVFRFLDDNEPTCPADCDRDFTVAVSELIRCVNIALGRLDLADCELCDIDGDGMVAINELITAVRRALEGC